MDSAIHLLNNWGLDCKINRKCKHLINFHHFLLLVHTAYAGRLQRSLTSHFPGVKIALVRCYMLVLREYRFLAIVHVGVSRQNFDFIKVFLIFVLILVACEWQKFLLAHRRYRPSAAMSGGETSAVRRL